MAKAKTEAPPAEPELVIVTMLRPVMEHPPATLHGPQTLPAAKALAWHLLDYCRLPEGWSPDPSIAPEAATIALEWLENERRARACSEVDFERTPANARRMRRVLALVNGAANGGSAA